MTNIYSRVDYRQRKNTLSGPVAYLYPFYQLLDMKKGLVALAALFLCATGYAQQEIKLDELNKHVGDSVTVCTKIFGGVFLERSKNTPTLLNAGGNYPNAPLTLVIWADAREHFETKPEVFYKDKDVCITGRVSLYKEKPQIVIYDERQLTIR